MEGINAKDFSMKTESLDGGRNFNGVLQVLYDSISELNLQLPENQRLEKSPGVALLGAGGKLDSLNLVNFIVISEQKLEDFLGFRVDLTQDDPFSASTGHFATLHSLATYIAELADKRMARTS
jgi:hypothetical protein